MYRTILRSAVFRVTLAAAIGLSPSAAVLAQQPVSAAQPNPAELDLGYATEQSFLGVIARPRQVLTDPQLAMLPYEVFQAAGKQHLGIDPLQVEEVQVFVEPPLLGPPQILVVARFSEPFALDQLSEELTRHTEPDELDGRPYLRAIAPTEPCLFAPNDRTLLFGTDEMLRRAYAGRGNASSSLIERLTRMEDGRDLLAAVELAPLRPLINAQLQQLPPLPPQLAPLESFKNAPNLMEAIEASIGLTEGNGPAGFSLVVHATDEEAAEELVTLARQGLELWQQQMLTAFEQASQSDDPVEQATGHYMKRISRSMADIYRPVRDGNRVIFFGGNGEEGEGREQLTQVATIGIFIALLLPAVQAAREAARRNQCRNNLRQLGISLHNHHDVYKRFPAQANYDSDGMPLLSWRVHILPFIEEQELYEQFRLDEPWDSEHNKKLIPLMPAIYADPSSPQAMVGHRTSYVAAVGEGLFMDGKEGRRIGDIKDGASRTIALVEVNEEHAPIWTEPRDIEIDPTNPAANLGGYHPAIFIALFVDDHVEEITEDVDPVLLWHLFTRAGGEPTGQP